VARKYVDFLEPIDQGRRSLGFPTIQELDEAAVFKPQLHTLGEHASPLIYACSSTDFFELNTDEYEVVAVTGNSMGWYTTLALASALRDQGGFELIQTMGSMMMGGVLGGQLIYPFVRDDWTMDFEKKSAVLSIVSAIHGSEGAELYVSIELGGYLVLAGNSQGLAQALKQLPKIEHFPFQLINHAAFHTPLLESVSHRALEALPLELFNSPKIPMVDGRGKIWQPYSTDRAELRKYTLTHQVLETYNFTKALEVAVKEFAPAHLVLLGPGNSLGSATAQTLIQLRWQGLQSKADFTERQKTHPFILSFGIPEQRMQLVRSN
jgi:acyl transferase domain-containing protein